MFKKFFKKDPFSRTVKISVKISPAEYKLFQLDAERNEMDFENWKLAALNRYVSADTISHLRKDIGPSINAALPLPQFPEILKPREKIQVPGHPCVNLDGRIPAHFNKESCQGTCKSNKQGYEGRPCFWASLVAKECPAFERKMVLTKK